MVFQFGAALAAFLATSGGPVPSTPPPPPATMQQLVPVIEPVALKQMMMSPARFVLIDVRRPDEFTAGHIEGASLMPLDTLPASYARLPRDVRLVVYCRSGHRSAQAVSFLREHGYGRAVSLNGGYLAWTAQR
jgi:adenylyltransferase/sulfurtransferase